MLFYTDNDGGTTFDPVVTKASGTAVSWDLGNGTRIIENNSISYSGYVDSTTKTVAIFDIDNYTQITGIDLRADGLVGNIPSLEDLTGITIFYCFLNALTGSIPALTFNTALINFQCYSNQLTGSIPSFSNNPDLKYFYCYVNKLTGSLPDFTANVVLINFRCHSNQVTAYAGGLDNCVALDEFRVDNNLLTEAAVSSIIDDLYVIRATIGGNSCAINIGGTGNEPPDADAIAKIEGTGAYIGDGLKDNGCTVIYNTLESSSSNSSNSISSSSSNSSSSSLSNSSSST